MFADGCLMVLIIWFEIGRPHNGWIALSRGRLALNTTAVTVRYVVQKEKFVVKERVAQTMLGDQSRDFWLEVKKLQRKNKCMATVVDDCHEPEGIANVFARSYKY
jgi:hypothetical protein